MPPPASQIRIIDEPAPLGDVPLAPLGLTGRSEAELARAMVEHLAAAAPTTGAEALKALRAAFPHSPLTVRLAALSTRVRR